MSSRSKTRHQNYGVSNAPKLARRVTAWLGKDNGKHAAHSFRRSAATALANTVSATALMHDGRWSSISVAQGFTEHAEREKVERVDGLAGRKDRIEKTNNCRERETKKMKKDMNVLHEKNMEIE